MPKKKLVSAKLISAPTLKSVFNDKAIYYSNFCLTDNFEIALFYIDDVIMQKDGIDINLPQFVLDENALDIIIDREQEFSVSIGGIAVTFEHMGKIKRAYYDWFKLNFPDCVFSPVVQWFGNPVNSLVVVLSEKYGKPVGIVKTFI